jgi:hypothetical protein
MIFARLALNDRHPGDGIRFCKDGPTTQHDLIDAVESQHEIGNIVRHGLVEATSVAVVRARARWLRRIRTVRVDA